MKEKRGRERSRAATMEERRAVLCERVRSCGVYGYCKRISEYKGIQKRDTEENTG